MRLLSNERKQTPNLSLLQCINAEKVDTIVEVVQEICELKSNQYTRPQMKVRPSVSLMTGNALRRCGEPARNLALKQRDKAMLKNAEAFLHVQKFEWPSVVSKPALSALSKQKQNNASMYR